MHAKGRGTQGAPTCAVCVHFLLQGVARHAQRRESRRWLWCAHSLNCFSAYLTLARAADIGRLLGAKWKELDEEERKPYVEQAAKDKMRAEEEKRVYEVRRVSVQERC
jgi:hypothetical protein